MSNVSKAENREPLIRLSRRASITTGKAWFIRIAAVLLGLLVCGIAAFVLIEKLQNNPGKIGEFYYTFIKGSFSSSRRIWKFLKNVSILLCISLALTPAFRMRFWNIGGEGQTLMGVLSAIAVAFYLGGTVPEGVLLLLMLLAALAVGAIWGVIPALFRAKWGTNETLFTLMMNYVATFIVGYFLIIWVPSGSSSLGKLKYGKLPMIVTDENVTLPSASHPVNAPAFMVSTFGPVTEGSLSASAKALSPISVTLLRLIAALMPVHPANM